ncbi:MAG: hypothetical protein GY933_20830, partial [Hyphomicrobiales bacterium]|nr:hypothetical protein [Hyphomicrobiales bacterium]
RALAGKRGLTAKDAPALNAPEALALPTSTPTMADLLHNGEIGPGKPLITGYNRQTGQPERRVLKDLKSVAVAGAQGSGKTASEAYLIGSAVLNYGVKAYVIDPHKHHPEGLHHLIEPLEQTGHVAVINPFDTPVLLDMLNRHLENRLNGSESSEQGILLVIDELARLAKMDCFDVLITFLERCTEETRKANMTFIGGSTKWNARHFKGRADIRGCMNSALVHRCKPSQAELLLEDPKDKKMMHDITQPGHAVLMTDCDTTKRVQIPFCTRQDMERIAAMIGTVTDTVPPITPRAARLADDIDVAVTTDGQDVTATSHPQPAATPNSNLGPSCEQKRKDLELSLRDVARKIGLTEKKKIATFATRLQRFEKNNGKLEPD